MKSRMLLMFAFAFLVVYTACAKSKPPKREFRAAWLATVANLDWPSSPYNSTPINIEDLIYQIDQLKKIGLNAVIFQVRPECDALYRSNYEPWSYWLTGQQGRAPEPYFDPLELAIREAHKRGMELHAWFNPYRAERRAGDYAIASQHVTKQHPEWILTFGNLKMLDPGIPAVREYVTRVIMDVVRRYDIDGVHFDDYFYPYSGITNEDDATFAQYSRGFTNRADWRRDNVNLLVEMVYDSIKAVKPFVKFGISPFGIWKNGVPPGIVGLDAYNVLYADAVAWLQKQIVDYLTPQLYWPFGGGQDYGKLMPWWASQTNGRHLYPGQAPYRILGSGWSPSELPRQIQLNRDTPNVHGSVFFRTFHVISNPKGFADSLRTNYYRHPALSPVMDWMELVPPNPPDNVRFDVIDENGAKGLLWNPPATASDGDTAFRYVIYRFSQPGGDPEMMKDAENIADLTGLPKSMPPPPQAEGPFYYGVTALDRNSNESELSPIIEVLPPPFPTLVGPVDRSHEVLKTDTLYWTNVTDAYSYVVQIADDSTFSGGFFLNKSGIQDTSTVITGLEGQKTYFWRVRAAGAGGLSPFSAVWSFTAGFPAMPVALHPDNEATGVPLQPTLVWMSAPGADYYRLQVAFSPRFNSGAMVVDSLGIADTTFTLPQLEPNKYYYWRVKAFNGYGETDWTLTSRFETEETQVFVRSPEEAPATYELAQNYPNPFQLSGGPGRTTIQYRLANSEEVSVEITIYNLMGQRIRTVFRGEQAYGTYQVSWDGRDEFGRLVSTGVYFYRIQAGDFVRVRKMLIVR